MKFTSGAPAAFAVVLLCLVPLLVTPVLPSIDFYGHIVRYYILAHVSESSWLAENYAPAWALLPNLGLDLIGAGLMSILPPFTATHLIAALIMVAPVAGAMALAAALHGRVTFLNAALAGILGSNLILSWGFSNFLFALGLALAATALWIALEGRPWLRMAVAIPSALLIMLAHGLMFAIWGLVLGAIELQTAILSGPVRIGDLARRAGKLLALVPLPFLLFLQSPTSGAEEGITSAFSNLSGYADRGALWSRLYQEMWDRLEYVVRVADTSWPIADRLFGAALWIGIAAALYTGALKLEPRLRIAVIGLAILIVFMPPNLFGVGYLDERIPLVLILFLSAGLVRPPEAPVLPAIGLAALFPLHLAICVISWSEYGRRYETYLAALDQTETGRMTRAYLHGGAAPRDGQVFCGPLIFLPLIKNGTALRTFAHPTQQPLRIVGPLDDTQDAFSAMFAAEGPYESVDDFINRAGRAGYDTVLVCGGPSETREPLSASEGWEIYETDTTAE